MLGARAEMPSPLAQRRRLGRRLAIAIALPILLLSTVGLILGRQIPVMSEDAHWVDHTDAVVGAANETLEQIIDQETHLRGYLLTGDPIHLALLGALHPDEGFDRLRGMVSDNPPQLARVEVARSRYDAWRASLAAVVDGTQLEAAKGLPAMRARKASMDGVRQAMQNAIGVEDALRASRGVTAAASLGTTKLLFVFLLGSSALLLALLTRQQSRSLSQTLGNALAAEAGARAGVEAEAWLRAGHARVTAVLQGERTLQQLGADCLAVLAECTHADVGAFFTREDGVWRRQAGYALDARATAAETFGDGEGLVGRAAADWKLLHLQEVPPDFLKIRSGTGEASPADVVVVPA